jgi:energy-converting hydrogenase Eha subunit E
MDLISTILSVLAIAVLITLAFAFGMAMLVFIAAVAVVTGVLVLLRGLFTRWNFERQVQAQEQKQRPVIETEYRVISEKDQP